MLEIPPPSPPLVLGPIGLDWQDIRGFEAELLASS